MQKQNRAHIYPVRTLMWLCAVYLVSLGLAFVSAPFGIFCHIVVSGMAAGLVVMGWLPFIPLKRGFCFASAGLILIALLQVQLTLRDYKQFQSDSPRSVAVTGTVVSLSYANDRGAAYVLDVDTMDGERVHGKLRIESYGGAVAYASPGESVSCHVILGEADARESYAEYRQYNFADGIYAVALPDSDAPFSVTADARGFRALCDGIATYCRTQIARFIRGDGSKLTEGIFLGDKQDLPATLKRDFRRVGLSHVLAVSGIHLSILVGGLRKFLEKTGLDKRIRLLLLCGFLVLFMGVTGFSPSILRAGLMWMIGAVSFYFGENTDPVTSLAFAGALICFFDPTTVLDLGFLLSVSATLGIVLLSPPTDAFFARVFAQKPWGTPIKTFLSACGITLAATIFTLPVTLFVFGEISLLAPLANLLMNPFATLILTLTPLFILATLLPFGAVAGFLGGCVSGTANLLIRLVSALSAIDFAVVGVRYRFLLPLFLLFVLTTVIVCFALRKKAWRAMTVYPVYICFCLLFALFTQIHATVTYDRVIIDTAVYKNNDIVTVVSGGRGMYIDSSDGAYTSAKRAWAQLSSKNITQLDAYVLTHLHAKHSVTLKRLSEEVCIRTLFLPSPETEEETEWYQALCTVAAGADIAVCTYRRGTDGIAFAGASLSFFPYATLARSVQPLLGYTVTAASVPSAERTFTYLSSSAFDALVSDAFAAVRDAVLSDTNVLYLGVHGPLIKERVDCLPHRTTPLAAVLFANADVRSYYEASVVKETENTVTLSETDHLIIVIK